MSPRKPPEARGNVLVTCDVLGQSKEGYEALYAMLAFEMRDTGELVAHTARPVAGGWQILEIWKSHREADRFFRVSVAPRLPPHVQVRRSVSELHNLMVCTS